MIRLEIAALGPLILLGFFGCGGTVTQSADTSSGGAASANTGGASIAGGGTADTSSGGVASANTGGASIAGGGTSASGTPATGGTSHTGGTSATPATGGATSGGGATATGGTSAIATTATGGTTSGGGATATGGSALGGATATGGTSALGSTLATGGVHATGGTGAIATSATSGATSGGGATATGGTSALGGATATGGSGAMTCATETHPVSLSRLNLVFLLDKSGSMGDDPNGAWQNATMRWDPVVETLDAFLTDPSSNGTYASLSIMPPTPSNNASMCDVTSYETGDTSIKVPLTLLDDPGKQQFLSLLCDPSFPPGPSCIVPSGGTPTRVALEGTLQYAASIRQQYPGGNTVVVLLTDGEPGFGYYNPSNSQVYGLYSCDDLTNGCTANPSVSPPCTTIEGEVATVAAFIRSAPAKSVFLVGVGDLSASTMDQWASASGNPAIALQDMSASQAAAALSAALQSIRSLPSNCSVQLPMPSGGQAVNPAKVNMILNANGTSQTLGRTRDGTSATCNTTTLGWYFDNPSVPTQINLCPTTCNAVRQSSGSVDVVYGCATVTL